MATPYDNWRTSRSVEEERAEATEEALAERAAELADEYRDDPAKCREAEEWVAGTFEGDHYTEVTLALHRLHYTDPSDLMGTDLLTQLYRLAKVEAAAMDARLLEMAEEAASDELRQAGEEAAEARAEARAAAMEEW